LVPEELERDLKLIHAWESLLALKMASFAIVMIPWIFINAKMGNGIIEAI
jgi:hypothetical protein